MTARARPFTVGRHRRVSVITGPRGTVWVSHVEDGAARSRISVTHAAPGGAPVPVATYGLSRDTVRLGASPHNVGAWADAVTFAGSLVA